MKNNAIKFLYALDCYLLYLLSGVVSALLLVVYYSVKAAMDYGASVMEFSDFLEYISSFLTGKSSVVLLISYALVILTVFVVFAIKKRNVFAYSGMSYASFGSIFGAATAGIILNILVHIALPQNTVPDGETGSLLLACALLAPIVEELMFRGILLKMFASSCGIGLSVFLTSVLFSVTHGDIITIAYTFVLGIILAVVRVRSTSLWSSVTLHLAFNITGAILVFNELNIDSAAGTVIMMIALCLFVMLACSGGRKAHKIKTQ